MSARGASQARVQAWPAGLPRLLAGIDPDRPQMLSEHLDRYGSITAAIPRDGNALIRLVEASGLRGRGGGGFPTAKKLQAVASGRRRPVVVVNGAEGEPLSGKDRVLLRSLPHVVLDGAAAAAAAVRAREAIVVVSAGARDAAAAIAAAIAARAGDRSPGRVAFGLVAIPDGFVSGEETSVVQFLNGGPPKPTFKPPWPSERGVGGAPTLVQNVETLAQLALIVRFGSEWFREIGTAGEPGSMLVTLSGAIRRPGVFEVEGGTSLVDVVARAGGVTEPPQAVLVGGYYGTWLTAGTAASLRLTEPGLRRAGAALGAGAIAVLPESVCGVAETARVARYLARESAGQCGPCVRGLDAVAAALETLATGRNGRDRVRLEAWLGQIAGRGACRHPDGAARFVSSALEVFADEVERHLRHGRCSNAGARILPIPQRSAA